MEISLQTVTGLIIVLIVAYTNWRMGYRQGRKDGLGYIMKLDEVPRNTRLQFRGLVSGSDHFLFAESRTTRDGLTFSLESRIARSPGSDRLDTLLPGDQFMVVEKEIGGEMTAIELMKLVK